LVPQRTNLLLNGAFTIELWVHPEVIPAGGFPGLLRKGRSSLTDANGGWLLWYDPRTRNLSLKRQNVLRTATGWPPAPPGSWWYTAVTSDGAATNPLRFYVNGALIGTAAGPAGGYLPLTSTDPLQIGRGDDSSSDQSLDEVALYTSALPAAAI